ncbi:MAG: glycosyltransferase family 2 protein [Actinobacteria bacterium]|nr:glycosyltransferase family 2 protein [Actinomycetota bacterium]
MFIDELGAEHPAATSTPVELDGSPELSIVVVTHDSRREIRACLDSIFRAAEPRWDPGGSLQVILVDNCSADGTLDAVAHHFPLVELVRAPRRRGYAANANAGASRAKGRILVLLNPDTRVYMGALTTLVDFLDSHPEVGICGPRLVFPDGSPQPSARRFPRPGVTVVRRTPLRLVLERGRWSGERHHLMLDERIEVPSAVDWLLGAAMVMRASFYRQLGGMDERYRLYCEDIDLCWRSWERGMSVVVVPAATVEHELGELTRKRFLTRATIWHGQSMARFVMRHGFKRPMGAPDGCSPVA